MKVNDWDRQVRSCLVRVEVISPVQRTHPLQLFAIVSFIYIIEVQ